MQTYNPINAILFILSCISATILILIEFDSTIYTIIQGILIVCSLLVAKLTHYDFDKFYNEEIKEK